MFSSYPAETSIPHHLSTYTNNLDLADEDDEDDDLDDDLMNQDFEMDHASSFFSSGKSMMTFPSADLHPEFTKLNGLNPFLALEDLPQSDKLLLIYEKILNELNESFDKHLLMQELDTKMTDGETLILKRNFACLTYIVSE